MCVCRAFGRYFLQHIESEWLLWVIVVFDKLYLHRGEYCSTLVESDFEMQNAESG